MDINRVEFQEIPSQGVVIARIRGTRYDAIDLINKKFVAHATSKIIIEPASYGGTDNRYLMPNSYKAVARCHPDDTYNFETGKRIALNKLIDTYHSGLDRRYALFLEDMDKVLKKMDVYFEGRTF